MKEVIKFLGKKEDLVWVYPKSSLDKDAKIVVDLGYLAIMVRNGEMEIPFQPGEQRVFEEEEPKFSILKSANRNLNDGTIYFFNKSRDVTQREWGTRYPITYFDKRYKMELTIRGHGTYKIYLDNPRLFLKNFKIDPDANVKVELLIKEMVIAKLTEVLAKVLMKGEYDLLSIHGFYDVITSSAERMLNEEFEPYGFSVFELRIAHLSPDEEDQLKALKNMQFKSAIFDTEVEMATKAKMAGIKDFTCPICQTPVNDTMKFCPNCGKNLKENGVGE